MVTTSPRFLVLEGSSDKGRVSLKVLGKSRKREISQVSRVLAQIPQVYQCARVFADVPPQRPGLKAELQRRSEKLWLELGG